MTKILRSVILVFAAVTGMAAHAENRWLVYGGGSISHLCESVCVGSDKSYGWGGGVFLGGGYEINFNSHWSLRPQVEVAFHNNGATLDSKEFDFYSNHANWNSIWSIDIPIMAGFRCPVSDKIGLRWSAGPYLSEALAGKHYDYGATEKDKLTGNISRRFNVGVIGEFAVEQGEHFSYMFRVQYPFLKEGWVRKTITHSLGIGYAF